MFCTPSQPPATKEPLWQPEHVRQSVLAVVEPGAKMYWPSGHSCVSGVHEVALSVPLLNWPCGHGRHCASATAEHGRMNEPAGHSCRHDEHGWLPLVALLSISFLLGNLALQYGAARLAAHTTALVMLSEVLFASVSSVLLEASSWDGRTLIGGALILLAALLSILGPAHKTD